MGEVKIHSKILDAIEKDNLVFFVGSGFSMKLGFPNWRGLLNEILNHLSNNESKYKILKDALQQNLMNEIEVLEKISNNKIDIFEKMDQIFYLDNSTKKDLLENHRKLGQITTKIITTNYDKSLESANPNLTKVVHYNSYRVAKLPITGGYIFKIHGCIENPSECILFKKDYEKLYESQGPAVLELRKIISDQTIIFLGFSLADAYVRHQFAYINNIYQGLKGNHFIITTRDEDYSIDNVIPIKIDDWSELSSFLDELVKIKKSAIVRNYKKGDAKGRINNYKNTETRVKNEEDKIEIIDNLNTYRESLYKYGLLSKEHLNKLTNIRHEVEKLWINNNSEQNFFPHDHTHCQRVEEMLSRLVPDVSIFKGKLYSQEIFLLFASVWLHDIGMFPGFNTDDPNYDSSIEWIKYVRKNHHRRSAEYVKKYAKELDLSSEEVNNLMNICFYHRQKEFIIRQKESIISNNDEVNIQDCCIIIIALLRLADILHIPRRIDNKELKNYLSRGMGRTAKFHWLKAIYVDSVNFCQEEFKITLTLKRPFNVSEDEMKPLENVIKKKVQDGLDSVKDIYSKYKLPFYLTVEFNYLCDLNESHAYEMELIELLKNIKIFDPAVTPNASSVMENVISLLKILLNPTAHSINYLKNFAENFLVDIKKERPCHVTLNKLIDNINTILSSNNSDRKKIENISNIVSDLESKKIKVLEGISKMSLGIIGDGLPILLYGYSNTIVNCIGYYLSNKPKDQKDLEIYICEARVKTEYRYNNRLIYCDGIKYAEEIRKISDKGIKIYIVPDVCASNLFSEKKVAKVLFGANVIELSGNVFHTMGHLAIADMAKMNNIPVYVIADSSKIGPRRKEETIVTPRKNDWLTTDIDFTLKLNDNNIKTYNPSFLNVPPKPATVISTYNPRRDSVPPERITAIVTEFGIVSPTDLEKHYNFNH